MVAGTANVAPQFTTVHTELFTAGLLSATYYLWYKAVLRRTFQMAKKMCSPATNRTKAVGHLIVGISEDLFVSTPINFMETV